MDSVVLLTVALMPSRKNLIVTKKSKKQKPKAMAVVELNLPNDEKANEVFLRIAAEFKHIAEALSPEEQATTLLEGETPQ